MHDVTLTILAGGRSSRMRTPKMNLEIRGQPVLHYLLDQANWAGPTLLVTAPGAEVPAGAERMGRHVCDPVTGAGPMRGILTALEHATTSIVVVAAVDMPGVRAQHLSWVANELVRRPQISGVLLARNAEAGLQVEPFPSAYRLPGAVHAVATHLDQQRKAVRSLLDCAGFIAVDAPIEWEASTWMNLNTPEDLQHFVMGDRP
jgi:molybdopterin-guanine dinucleotide biosynthesis protein A